MARPPAKVEVAVVPSAVKFLAVTVPVNVPVLPAKLEPEIDKSSIQGQA